MSELANVKRSTMGALDDLLDTAGFSLETVQMALSSTGRSSHNLDARMKAANAEERDAGRVAVEALDMARTAFRDLAECFGSEDMEGVGLELGFWSSFEWCWERLFTEAAHRTSPTVLHHELSEARRRTDDLRTRLHALVAPTITVH